jgi:hypothetical protein
MMRGKTPAQLLSFKLHTFSLPKASPSLKRTCTRRTSEHCLGTFKTAEKKFLAPLNVVPHATSHHFLFFLSLSLFPCIPLSFLDNGSVNTFPRQRRIVGGVVFCAVHVVSKESRQSPQNFVFEILSYLCSRPWRPVGLWDVEASTFSRQSAHRWRWGCQLYVPVALYPQEDSLYSFLLEAESTTGP